MDELLIVDRQVRAVHWLGLADGEFRPIERSGLIELSPDELAARITWPYRSRTPDLILSPG